MLGGGKLTSKIGLGTDFGFMTSTGDINNVEIKPNYSLSSFLYHLKIIKLVLGFHCNN